MDCVPFVICLACHVVLFLEMCICEVTTLLGRERHSHIGS